MSNPIHTLAIMVTNRCNARCLHCAFWSQEHGHEEISDFAPYYRLIEDLATISPGSTLTLTGGEPFLCTELFDLIRSAKSLGQKKVVIPTNGLALKEDRVPQLCQTGVDELVISLDGFAETHDQMRGVPGAYNQVWRLIDSIHSQEIHPDTLLLLTICRQNIGEMRRFISEVLKDPRIARICFQVITQPMPAVFDSQWQASSQLWPEDFDQVSKELGWLIEQKENGARIHNQVSQLQTMIRYFKTPDNLIWKSCNVGTRYLLVGTDGLVKNCINKPPIGNIRSDKLQDILSSPQTVDQLAEMSRCKENCHFLVNCGFLEGKLI